MSRRRIPGEQPESFNLRWHSVANPATPSADIMSSPDPLNDPATPDPITSSATRRITRSQRAQKFLSLGVSPRKQAYELDVGNSSRSSRGLMVSVEEDHDQTQDGETRRRLFPTPSPGPASRRREKITTTTVPLKDSIEDESSDVLGPSTSTPQPRRGRLRTSNGTPIPKSGRKRRAGTPIRRTPRRPETVPDSMSSDNASDAGMQASPTPKRRTRTRTPKKRAVEPSSELGTEPASAMTSVRRSGRRRRQALAPDELAGLTDAAQGATIAQEPQRDEDNVDLIDPADAAQQSIPTPASEGDAESDIWMTTLSQDATPRASALNKRRPTASPVAVNREPSEELYDDDDGGYGYLPPGGSDVSSADEPPAAPTVRNDTIAQGEDFSMIFMDSIPHLQADLSRADQGTNQSELGEDTNLIINNTLESLRNGADADREDEGEDDDIEASEDEPAAEEQEIAASEEDAASVERVVDPSEGGVSDHEDEADPLDAEELDEAEQIEASEEEPDAEEDDQQPPLAAEPGLFVSQDDELEEQEQEVEAEMEGDDVPEPTPIRSPLRSSPKTFSPRQSESPRKPKKSPLRHRVLKQSVTTTQESPRQGLAGSSPNRTPRASERNVNIQEPDQDSGSYDDSFSEIPDAVLEAATPGRPGMGLTYDNDMDDDVDDEAIEAAFNEAEVNQAETRNEPDELLNDQFEGQMEEDAQADDDGRVPFVVDDDQEDVEEDYPAEDFGDEGIPDAFDDDMEDAAADDADEMAQDLIEDAYPGVLPEMQSHSSPRHAPPSLQDEPAEEEALQQVTRRSRSRSLLSSASRRSQVQQPPSSARSQRSAAAQAEADIPRSGSSKDATPRNQISSPLQEPQSLVQGTIHGSRPTLSPIVRAGRVLQSVTSDPPSPEGRERQLGSPFRSSGSKDSHSGAREGQEGRITSRSPTARTLSFARPPTAPSSATRRSPFTNIRKSPEQLATAAAAEDTAAAAAVPVNRSTSSRPSASSSMRHSPPSEGVMSWVANEAPLSPNLRGDNSLLEAAATSTTKFSRPQFVPAVAQAAPPVAENESSEEEARDDETDIWEIEAQRETPKPAQQASFGTSKRFSQTQRRPGLPLPWMRSSQTAPKSPGAGAMPVKLTLEGEGSEEGSPQPEPQTDVTEHNETEEYSLLEKRREEEVEAAAGSPAKGSKFDLSSFFSSPAAIPGLIAGKLFPGSSKPVEAAQPTAEQLPTTTANMFPEIPQKQFRPATSGRRDLFSPKKSQPSQPSKQPQITGQPSAATRGSSSPETPEQLGRPSSAGNQTFTPRQRKTSSTFAHPSSRQSTAVTPPRMQLSHADIRKWQQDMSSASASADESSDFIRPLLRPLPPKNASPTKSSLRSPLKPRTPGRVVEFTSSVLSPLEQARARQQSQMSSSVASHNNSLFAQPYRQQQPSQHQVQVQEPQYPDLEEHEADDKENHDSDISMADAPPLERGPLSQSSWTRNHWLLLDELIQLRRQAPFEPNYERRSDKYLGKTVKSQGEAMVLQRWHLDCVDAFKAEVGGWDEGALAKRLFALILGEERRSREAELRNRPAAPATGFMFH
ncbi:hypothetical protein K4F52_001669 [Lecanicillium sp. MT-2017a]|nr:hypothetical protein K4F52_001669 [Lecanicillium sp. MT-2017a]